MKKIAFAAGWLSHITGDLACHGIFVNPECAVYLYNESTRTQHRKLENNAEAVVWADICKKPIEDYNKGISSLFSNINDVNFMPSDVSTVSIKKKEASASLGADWYLKSINVNVNGIYALSENVESWIEGSDAVKEFKVDLNYITNISDS